MKLQSAMEYLMTYGWAMLIIAVVLVALFELNLFNPNTLAPKAQPGSCSVVRNAYGGATLSGTCTSNIPKFVAQFDGNKADILIPYSIGAGDGDTTNTITYSAWVKTTYSGMQAVVETGVSSGFEIDRSGQVFLHECNHGDSGITVNSNNLYNSAWHFIAITYSSGTLTGYVDGSSNSISTSIFGVSPIPPPTIGAVASIGYDFCDNSEYFTGDIANVQIYNTSLSANSIQALYLEGIGGTPINLQNLVGWWPLNGNTNDYSGNGNNGVTNSISYSSNWYTNYVQP